MLAFFRRNPSTSLCLKGMEQSIDIAIWGCFHLSDLCFVVGLLRHANIIQRGAAPSEYGPCFETQIAGWSHGCSGLGNFVDIMDTKRYLSGQVTLKC